jgi:hypothetical protein
MLQQSVAEGFLLRRNCQLLAHLYNTVLDPLPYVLPFLSTFSPAHFFLAMPVQVQTHHQQTETQQGVLKLKAQESVPEDAFYRNQNSGPLAYNGSLDRFEAGAGRYFRLRLRL